MASVDMWCTATIYKLEKCLIRCSDVLQLPHDMQRNREGKKTTLSTGNYAGVTFWNERNKTAHVDHNQLEWPFTIYSHIHHDYCVHNLDWYRGVVDGTFVWFFQQFLYQCRYAISSKINKAIKQAPAKWWRGGDDTHSNKMQTVLFFCVGSNHASSVLPQLFLGPLGVSRKLGTIANILDPRIRTRTRRGAIFLAGQMLRQQLFSTNCSEFIQCPGVHCLMLVQRSWRSCPTARMATLLSSALVTCWSSWSATSAWTWIQATHDIILGKRTLLNLSFLVIIDYSSYNYMHYAYANQHVVTHIWWSLQFELSFWPHIEVGHTHNGWLLLGYIEDFIGLGLGTPR